MIAHIVLFRPRPDLAAATRQAMVTALETACQTVPTIRRATVGRAQADDAGMTYPFTAVLEFDDEAGLRAYFAHPAHGPLARLFHQTCEATLIVNAEMIDGRTPLAPFLLAPSGADR